MNKVIRTIEEIDQKFKCVTINFKDNAWRDNIPAKAGWYLIKTNAPIAILKSVGEPKPEYKAHINIPSTIKETSILQETGIAITQSANEEYIIYNGEANNLKVRAREHLRGHHKTYCLGLSNYDTLYRYKWTFCYVTESEIKSDISDDKLFRLAVEQAWRAKNGWPILCRK